MLIAHIVISLCGKYEMKHMNLIIMIPALDVEINLLIDGVVSLEGVGIRVIITFNF
jgi:hypothetical protein